MTKMGITFSNDQLQKIAGGLKIAGEQSFPATREAFKQSANFVAQTWRGYAKGGDLQGITPMKNPSAKLASSIKVHKNGPFDYEISSDSEQARRIEEGTEELDMKKTHPYGPKSRVSIKTEKGVTRRVPYLIVPMRWGTPRSVSFRSVMPEEIYNIVKQRAFKKSVVEQTTHFENNFIGDATERREYTWGSALSGEEFGNAEGMVKMANRGGHFTFRIISAESPAGSWIRPAQPPKPVIQAVATVTQDVVNAMVEQGLREDIGI